MPDTKAPRVSPVPPPLREGACRLMTAHLPEDVRQPQAESLLAAVDADQAASEGFLGAFRADRLVGAVFSQILPGKTAVVWPPRLIPGEPSDTAQALLESTSERFLAHHVRLAQVLLESDDCGDEPVLREAGYEFLANLLYLVCPDDEFPGSLPQGPVEFEPYCPANHERFTRVLEATYDGTLDCPGIDGMRENEDVLAGYRATGVFDPGRWLIVRHETSDIGCLVLTDHPEHGNLELIYMGIVPASRGHGWGMDIARYGAWRARQAGRERLVVAVDAVNEPAIRMYAAVGFRAWDQRSVYLKIFAAS